MIELTKNTIAVDKVREAVADPSCGAVVLFEGQVRNHHNGQSVLALEYEVYPKMVLTVIESICEKAKEKWPLGKVAVVHRYGRLEIGEVAVVVAVSSAHRQEAFEAASYVMEQIKHEAPIWKKEFYQDQTSDWVFCSHQKKEKELAGALLAGGHSRRFGSNKAFALKGDEPFYQIGLNLLKKSCSEIVISSNEPKLFEKDGLLVVEDRLKEKGPLGGVYTLLKTVTPSWLLVLACDMPQLTEKSVNLLLKQERAGKKAICFKDEKKLYPFPGLFHKSLEKMILNCISMGELRVSNMIDSIPEHEKKILSVEALDDFKTSELSNINTRKEYVKL